ncbi:MAG TPA: DUF2911 domain-containing protein [Cyclobacteriaceae bacterium]|nr:DUF2911 domain-containing protein [Cyclobacteriaceae bacterium]
MFRLLAAAILSVALTPPSVAQDELKPRVSPLNLTSIHYKEGYLKVVYSQPQKHGREVFGKLVPFGEVWRTGANEATEITITQDANFNGSLVKAGTYALFTIPEKEKWTIILNKDLGQWGAYNYSEKKDVLRFDVASKSIPENVVFEPFTIRIDQKTDTAEMFLLWDKTQVSFIIQFIESKP